MAKPKKKKKKAQIYQTPVIVSAWPKLNQPDTKFNKNGTYSVKAILDPNKEDHAEFISTLNKINEKALDKFVEENGDATMKDVFKSEDDGTMTCIFKCNAQYTNKEGDIVHMAPSLYDADLNRIDAKKVAIWGGSEMIISFTISPYDITDMSENVYCGLSLRLKGAQITKLVQGGDDAGYLGFKKQEDGFVVSNDDDDDDVEEFEPEASSTEEDNGDF